MRDGGFDAGRRFRRGVLGVFLLVVLLVAALASVVASLASGTHPKPFFTIAIAALVLVGLLVTARWLWRSARSIGSLMDAADRVAGGDYTTRVGEVPGRPYQRLAGAFDEMTSRLQTNEERRRELLADVAHELRTPLQAIRGATEGMLDGLYPLDAEHLRPVIERTDVMARLLDDLRTLSMAEAGVLELHRETVDPRGAAEDAAKALRADADEAGVTIDVVDQGAPATIEADPVRLAEILSNLLANAARYTPHGGRVIGHDRGGRHERGPVHRRRHRSGHLGRSTPLRVRPVRAVGGPRRHGARPGDRETAGRSARRHDRGRRDTRRRHPHALRHPRSRRPSVASNDARRDHAWLR